MRYRIGDILACNMTLYKLLNEQKKKISIPNGFKLYQMMKIFDDVENYVFSVMSDTFGSEINYNMLSDEQREFYDTIMNVEVELSFEKIDANVFENEEDSVKVTIDEIDNLQIIFKTDE